jgi:hypothetical protein
MSNRRDTTMLETETDKLLDRKTEEAKGRIHRAIDRGGLPTEAEIDAVDTAIMEAYNLVEDLAVRVSGIAEIENGAHDAPPYTVTLEQIGLVAAVASDLLDLQLDQLHHEAMRIRNAIGPLDTIRRQQS